MNITMVLRQINEDLQKERRKCNFDIEEVTNLLDRGAKYTNIRRSIEDKILSVDGLLDTLPDEFRSHKEKYENAIRKVVTFQRAMVDIENTINEEDRIITMRRCLILSAVFKDHHPFSLHNSMFIPTITGQGTEEQKAYWLKRARNLNIIGTYAQTELGHGTFIRGLETTATYDPSTEEFVLNSPKLTAYKWWPGSLAHTANYCVVVAQMYSKGQHCGVQLFMVQLRDEETHMPLPGIKIGEIGVKMAFNLVNNGFLGFDNVRIPRDRMLMRNAQVLKDGTFVKSPDSKLAYGTMVFVRVLIVNDMSNQLARAITIAVRYSAIRRQSQIKPDEPESQILDYVTQQHKLFIAIASSYAISMTATCLWELYGKVTSELSAGTLDTLPELHALACCLKAVCTSDVATMVERCRMSCGGHGFMASSNFPFIYGIVAAACTYEGENTVMMLQTARSLAKAWDRGNSGETLTPTMAYLTDRSKPQKWDGSVDGIVRSFQLVARGKVSCAVTAMKNYMKAGLSPEDAWNKCSVQLVAASEGHCRAFLLSTFSSEVKKRGASLSPAVRKVLTQLVELYAVYWSLEKLADLLLYTSVTEKDVQVLRHRYEELLEAIRPNAVGLVDAFDFRDEILNSTLGAYDGRVYERLMEEALKSPLNQEPVNQSFHKYLKPLMQGKL